MVEKFLNDLIKIYETDAYILVFKNKFHDSKIWDNLNISEIEKFFDDEIMKLVLEYRTNIYLNQYLRIL